MGNPKTMPVAERVAPRRASATFWAIIAVQCAWCVVLMFAGIQSYRARHAYEPMRGTARLLGKDSYDSGFKLELPAVIRATDTVALAAERPGRWAAAAPEGI
jgi:hypothetical protein